MTQHRTLPVECAQKLDVTVVFHHQDSAFPNNNTIVYQVLFLDSGDVAVNEKKSLCYGTYSLVKAHYHFFLDLVTLVVKNLKSQFLCKLRKIQAPWVHCSFVNHFPDSKVWLEQIVDTQWDHKPVFVLIVPLVTNFLPRGRC